MSGLVICRALLVGCVCVAVGCQSAVMHPSASPPRTSASPVLHPVVPSGTKILLGVIGGRGTKSVGSFVPDGPFSVRWTCLGDGQATETIASTWGGGSEERPCDGTSWVDDYASPEKVLTSLAVTAAPGTSWSIEVESGL
jgi:hypothetical protein